MALEGAKLTGSNVYIFTVGTSGIKEVAYWLDDPNRVKAPVRTERYAPYDFGGTAQDGSAQAFNASSLAAGKHSITQVVTPTVGAAQVTTEKFEIGSASSSSSSSSSSGGASSSSSGGPVNGAAARRFSTSFDDFPGFEHDPEAVLVTKALDGTPCHTGSCVRMNWNGVVAWNDPLNADMIYYGGDWQYNREFLIRYWMYIDKDVDYQDGVKLYRMESLEPNGNRRDQIIGGGLWFNRGGQSDFHSIPYVTVKDVGYKPWGCGGNCPTRGAWHRYDIYVRKNGAGASDGAIRYFYDGKLVRDYSNIVSHTPNTQYKFLSFPSNWSGGGLSRGDANKDGIGDWDHDANNHLYVDDFEVFSDVTAGRESVTGSMADGTVRR